MSSRSRGWIFRSYTGTVGKPVMNFCHEAPRSSVTYAPLDVPTYSRSRFTGSSRNARMTSIAPPDAVLRLLTIDRKDFPPSVVMYRYGVKSFQRWLSNATYAV